ncbi:unnamed protein product, partial [Allacma fusca]
CMDWGRGFLIANRVTQLQLDALHDVMVNGVPETQAPLVICDVNTERFSNCITTDGTPVGLERVEDCNIFGSKGVCNVKVSRRRRQTESFSGGRSRTERSAAGPRKLPRQGRTLQRK